MANNSGGPWGGGPRRPSGGGDDDRGAGPRRPGESQIPEIDEIMRKGQEQLRVLMGGKGGGRGGDGGSGGPSFGRGTIGLIVLALVGGWLFASFYSVRPEERSIELFLGDFSEIGQPGLNFAPWPLVTHEVIAVTTERIEQLGVTRNQNRGDEGLMLTTDENIVDIDYQVVWNVQDPAQYLFNLRDPDLTVRAVSEAAMREVISQSELAPILNRDRAIIAQSVLELVQGTLDTYNAGINIVRVNLDRADPPEEVIDAFREVQAAEQERDRLERLADAYANRELAGARGEAAQILEEAEGYRARVVNEAEGEASRFSAVLAEYTKAPVVTRKRLYLETMEEVLGRVNKVILDENGAGQGVVPYLPLNELNRPPPPPQTAAVRRVQLMRRATILLPVLVIALVGLLSSIFIVDEREKALVLQFGQIKRVKEDPGLAFKIPIIQTVVRYDDRILSLDTDAIEVTPSDDRRLVVDAFARYRIADVVNFREALGAGGISDAERRLGNILDAQIRAVLGSEGVTSNTILSEERTSLMNRIRDVARERALAIGLDVIDVRLKQTNLPEQNLEATFSRMRAEREREAADEIARGEEAAQRVRALADRTVVEIESEAQRESEITRGEADALRNSIFAEAYGRDSEFFEFYRSLTAYQRALNEGNSTLVVSPDSEFFDYLQNVNPRGVPMPDAAPAPAAAETAAPEGDEAPEDGAALDAPSEQAPAADGGSEAELASTPSGESDTAAD